MIEIRLDCALPLTKFLEVIGASVPCFEFKHVVSKESGWHVYGGRSSVATGKKLRLLVVQVAPETLHLIANICMFSEAEEEVTFARLEKGLEFLPHSLFLDEYEGHKTIASFEESVLW